MKIIAKIHNDFKEKFGIPRQSGLADSLVSRIIFEPEYRVKEALRGIEGFSHLWLIWEFSKAKSDKWSPTVRPPRLGGNKRMGVFATRSPYRPNPIGLSSVRLIGIEETKEWGAVLLVSGADLLDGTPIYDIKPYLSFADSHPDSKDGFAEYVREDRLTVEIGEDLLDKVIKEKREGLIAVLKGDPRPSYQDDPERIYGMKFSDYEIFFKVSECKLKVTDIKELK